MCSQNGLSKKRIIKMRTYKEQGNNMYEKATHKRDDVITKFLIWYRYENRMNNEKWLQR